MTFIFFFFLFQHKAASSSIILSMWWTAAAMSSTELSRHSSSTCNNFKTYKYVYIYIIFHIFRPKTRKNSYHYNQTNISKHGKHHNYKLRKISFNKNILSSIYSFLMSIIDMHDLYPMAQYPPPHTCFQKYVLTTMILFKTRWIGNVGTFLLL